MPKRHSTPGAGPINNTSKGCKKAYKIQHAFLQDTEKAHGTKTHVLLLHNGMIGQAWCHSVAQNDLGMINLSSLDVLIADVS